MDEQGGERVARYRCIEPELWRNRFLRRSGMVVREVFTFCFSALADDEGRFDWQPDRVLDEAFGRDDPVEEKIVSDAMDALAEEGMLVRYGPAREFGFVAGWFQHQVIDARNRHESALPRPPALVGSWSEADEARKRYAVERGIDLARALYRDAVRWLNDKHMSSTSEALVEHAPEGKGREVEGNQKGSKDSALLADAEACRDCGKQHKAKAPEKMGSDERTLNRAFEAMTGQRVSCVRVAIIEKQKADGKTGEPLRGIAGVTELIGATNDALIDELLGHPNCPRLPDGKKPWPWFSKHFKDSINRPWEWRKQSGGNGPEERASFADWPKHFEVEALREEFTDEEVQQAARSPDYYRFPRHNINGTEQMRLEKARRDYEREQASEQGK